MSRHIDSDLLQDLREGLLPVEEERRVRSHLNTCQQCRGEMEALSGLLDGLGALPVDARPSRDLWPQIAWRISADGARPDEDEEPGRAADSAPTPQRVVRALGPRVAVPVWQLLAAGIVVALVSGTSVWAFLSAPGGPADPVLAPAVAEAQLAGWTSAYDGYDGAMDDLEAVLRHGREVLDPETVKVLEENLKTIDDAIAEARAALDRDPASPVLQRILAENLRKKLGFLRQAASAVYANT